MDYHRPDCDRDRALRTGNIPASLARKRHDLRWGDSHMTEPGQLGRRIPILRGILPLDGARVQADIIAGITLAALAIPEVLGYTKISGTPIITGLYTILIPMTLYALFGASRHQIGRA